MKTFHKFAAVAVALTVAVSGCTTNAQTGERQISKTALYGVGAAVTCGVVGALTHGSKGARNSALACGAVGAGVGGYMDYQEKLLRDKLKNTEIQVQRAGDQIKLVMPENVTFATGSAALSAQSTSSLNDISGVLAQYNETNVSVNGHTDTTGSDKINQPLSEKRAGAVASYLQNKGVSASRIRTVGYGSKQPIASNANAAGRAKNRRVEILIDPQAQ